MRLLDTETGQFVDSVNPEIAERINQWRRKRKWVYAILSHTWDKEGEQTYEQLKKIQEKYLTQVEAPESNVNRDRLDAGASSSPRQPEGEPPPAHSSPSQLPSDLASVNSGTPLMATSETSKSWFARRMALMKRLFRRLSARNAPAKRQSNPPSVTTCLLLAGEHLTPCEVNALRRFIEMHGLTSPTPAPTSGDPSAPSQGKRQSEHSPKSIWDDPELSSKIKNTCAVARKNGYRYIWIDSCCIDKSSSSELSEAINSMFKWYSLADVCYAYLADVPPGEDHQAKDSDFRQSRWFERGWTLQELIAPISVEFLSQDWAPIGSKHTLHDVIGSITGISRWALLHLEPLGSFSVAQRFSWAARRETTREEDRAYSLLGIFDIHMPTLYGEGDRAFQRLQEQIMQRIPDQSLFAWGDVHLPDSSQLSKNQIHNSKSITFPARPYRTDKSASAESPSDFTGSRNIQQVELPASLHHKIGYTTTPYGICTQLQMIPLTFDLLSYILPSSAEVESQRQLPVDSNQWYLAILGCEHTERSGYLLGRVYCIPPSKSGVEFVYTGHIQWAPYRFDLFSLSPDTIKHFHSNIKLKTVHIPHPSPASHLQITQNRPYSMIKLVLLTETLNALRYGGYHADLRGPDPDRPTIHWLTLSNDEQTITVEFQHTLNDDGWNFIIDIGVKTSGLHVQLDPALDSDQADRHSAMCWRDTMPWYSTLGPETVRLKAAGGKMLTVELSLDFGGEGFYYVRVDVRSNAPPAPIDVDSALPVSLASKSAVEMAQEVEVTRNDSPSGVIDTEDWEVGREVEAGEHGTASVDGGRAEETAGDAASGELHGGSA